MRAQVVLLNGDRILLARHVRGEWTYWVLPGGAVEGGETPEEAGVREVREETGLDVEIDRLLFVDGPRQVGDVRINRPRHTFLGRIVGGELRCVEECTEGASRNGYLAGAVWMPFDSPDYDVPTRDTLRLVREALATERCSGEEGGLPAVQM